MGDIDVKAAVRARDGHKCQKCGMTSEQHQERYETALHVHRLLPGSAYIEEWCVTLCTNCHGPMPRKMVDLTWKEPEASGVVLFWLNLFDHTERRFWEAIKRHCLATDKDLNAVLTEIFERWLADQPPDYCI